jgi:selenocysteine-specific elongation factor
MTRTGYDFVLGTAGHIDHGKTTLIRALTGVDCDRLGEEQARGITIVLGFAPITLPSGRRGGVVDVPGHERFVRTMIAGATGIDLALMVVAADEGMMPQTREHLAILDLLRVRRGVVAVTKADLVDEELQELACEEVADGLEGTTLAGSPVIPCSGETGQGLDELREALDAAVEGIQGRVTGGPFRLPVDRVFSLRGFGTVVTGTCISGTVTRGEEVEILPGQGRTRVRGIEVHGEARDEAVPSRRTALNLQGIGTDDVPRGAQVVTPGRVCESSMIDVEMRVLESSPMDLTPGTQVRFLTGTNEAIGIFDPIDDTCAGGGEGAEPGWEGNAQLRLDRPVAVARGDQVILRRISPIVTLGGGKVIDPTPIRFRARRRARHSRLATVLADAEATLADRIAALLTDAEPFSRTAPELARRLSTPLGEVRAALKALASEGRALVLEDGTAATADVLTRFGPQLAATVDEYHRAYPLRVGAPRDQLRTSLKVELPRPLFEAILARVAAAEGLEDSSGRIRRRDFEPTADSDQRRELRRIEDLYRQAALQPPNLGGVRAAFRHREDFEDLLGFLRDSGRLLRVTGDLLVHEDVWKGLVADVRHALAGGKEMDPPTFKGLTGLSRKHAIPYLEMLDKQRVTVRVGNVRKLKE